MFGNYRLFLLYNESKSFLCRELECRARSLIRFIEIAIALLIASRPFFPKASVVGSVGAMVTFLLTISFLFSTPGALKLGQSISILGGTGQFIIKDLVLLGASCWIAAEAVGAAGKQINPRV